MDMVEMKRDRTGMAAIFDALIFLTAVSVVSTSMLAAVASVGNEKEDDRQTYVERAASVLLRATVPMNESVADSANISIMELSILLLSSDTMDASMKDHLASEVRIILGFLLSSSLHFEWVISLENRSIEISGNSFLGNKGDIYVSTQEVMNGPRTVTFVLKAWYA